MNKIKKVFISFGIIITGLVSKVLAFPIVEQTKYGVIDPRKDGIFAPGSTILEKFLSIGKLAIPIILFIIGLLVILSKKITNKVKKIIISILVTLAIVSIIIFQLMKYYSNII